ncbi:MAG: VWA domain-containing protein, partial [Pseudomonadales bacterium]|nr:VWA domain-containing protein [Pseudomonadales bacterium]
VLVLCDVSGSVQAYSRFLLLFLHSLNDVLQRIDSYVFTGALAPVNHIFDSYPVAEAIDRIMAEHGFGGSDYGGMLRDLERDCLDAIDHRTTVLILGDARNNQLDPCSHILRQVRERAKRVLWLNPEPESFWGTGDSVMRQYRPHCHVARTCNTLEHLERLLDDLLKSATATAT